VKNEESKMQSVLSLFCILHSALFTLHLPSPLVPAMTDKKLPCRKSEIVFVVWKDAVGQSTRAQHESVAELQRATNINVGWIVHENAERLVLGHGISTTGELDHLVIPIANVVERIALRGRRGG